jgi:general secretion pathway protein G
MIFITLIDEAGPNGSTRRRHRGITLVELLVVLAMAVALTAIAVPIYQNYMDDVRLANVIKDVALISVHLERHRTENRGQLPETLAETPAGMLRDPWGNPYQYLNIETATGPGLGNVRKDKNLVPLNTDFDLYSMGEDGASKSPLTAAESHDDIIRANNGGYVGRASEY